MLKLTEYNEQDITKVSTEAKSHQNEILYSLIFW